MDISLGLDLHIPVHYDIHIILGVPSKGTLSDMTLPS